MQHIFFGFLILVHLLFPATGEPVATLTCKSSSGRTLFTAVLPDCDYVEKAEFSIDRTSMSFAANDTQGVIFDPENKTFTISIVSRSVNSKTEKFLKFWALPSSFTRIKHETGSGTQFHDVYEFHAKLFATEPRKGFEYNTKIIELICTLDYQL
jgi:hypothetical protein